MWQSAPWVHSGPCRTACVAIEMHYIIRNAPIPTLITHLVCVGVAILMQTEVGPSRQHILGCVWMSAGGAELQKLSSDDIAYYGDHDHGLHGS